MPGNANPVMAEALIRAAAQVIAYDAAITLGGPGGYLELNVMMPLIAYDLLSGIELLANAVDVFGVLCVRGIEADEARCREAAGRSLTLATALAPVIGYDRAAEVAQEAARTGRTVREVSGERGVLPPERLDELLDPRRMTEPGV